MSDPARSYTLTHAVGVSTHFTRAELAALDFCARRHYDGRCVSAALRRGEASPNIYKAQLSGFIAALFLRLELDVIGEPLPAGARPESVEASWTFDEFDTSMKILEMSPHFPAQVPREVVDPLCRKLRICMAAISAESRRLREARQAVEIVPVAPIAAVDFVRKSREEWERE